LNFDELDRATLWVSSCCSVVPALFYLGKALQNSYDPAIDIQEHKSK
jgi:hypothetical protein